MGLNEAAGYGAVAVTALATGAIAARYGLRPEPFFLGLAYAALGLGLSTLFVRETHGHARHEATTHVAASAEVHEGLSTKRCSSSPASRRRPSRPPARPAWSTTSTTASRGASSRCSSRPMACRSDASACSPPSTPRCGASASSSPAHCRTGSAASGSSSPACSRRRSPSASSPRVHGFWMWAVGALLLGAGTAMVYPTLLAAIGDVAHPTWRASSVGVYRLWRDGGFAVGAVLAGVLADAFSIETAIWAVAGPHRRVRFRRRRPHVRDPSRGEVPRWPIQSARPRRHSGDRRRVPRAASRLCPPRGPRHLQRFPRPGSCERSQRGRR